MLFDHHHLYADKACVSLPLSSVPKICVTRSQRALKAAVLNFPSVGILTVSSLDRKHSLFCRTDLSGCKIMVAPRSRVGMSEV